MKYLAYGSNMDPKRMLIRGAPFTSRIHATLVGYSLKFNKTAASARAKKGEGKGNIKFDPTGISKVEGALYTIMEDGLNRLDQNEGYPEHYDRKEMDIYLDDGSKVKAWVYIAQPNMVAEGLKPTKEYLSHYLKGKDLLSSSYFQLLLKTETLE
ncbi:MAG: gamma-glutamylcyclotransferase family protein [Candidatus Bathyarchaeia archaeon]